VYNKVESDEALIIAVKNGDCESFNPLIERYKLPLYKVMYRMVLNRDDAEDLVEEAFIKAYRSIKRFDTSRPFYTWLRRIAVNNAINFLKKERRNLTEPLEFVEKSLSNGRNDPIAMTKQKVSKLLKIPKGTVMSRLARARQRLRQIFDEMEVH